MSQQGEDYNNTSLKFLSGLTEWKWETVLYLTHTQSIIQLLTVRLSDYLTMQIVKEHKASSALSLFSSMPQTSDASRVQFNPLTSLFQRGLKQFKRKRRSTGPGLSSKILTTEENCVLFLPLKFSHLMLYKRPGKWEDSYTFWFREQQEFQIISLELENALSERIMKLNELLYTEYWPPELIHS